VIVAGHTYSGLRKFIPRSSKRISNAVTLMSAALVRSIPARTSYARRRSASSAFCQLVRTLSARIPSARESSCAPRASCTSRSGTAAPPRRHTARSRQYARAATTSPSRLQVPRSAFGGATAAHGASSSARRSASSSNGRIVAGFTAKTMACSGTFSPASSALTSAPVATTDVPPAVTGLIARFAAARLARCIFSPVADSYVRNCVRLAVWNAPA
jgi:hypothetical protein